MLLIVAFSAGLGLVLSGIGLAVLYGGRWMVRRQRDLDLLQRLPRVARLARSLLAFSGLLVIGAGGLLLYNALPLLRIWQL